MAKRLAVANQAAGLITIEPWHEDVAENQRGPTFDDFGQSLESIFGQKNGITRLGKKNLGRAPDHR